MFLVFRKAITSHSPCFSRLSDNMSNINGSCLRLSLLAQNLRRYKPPPPPPEEDDDDVVPQVGFAESATNQSSEKFKPRKAAVLICLFEDKNDNGLRVILTKRSSRLSTHSGEVSLPGGKAEEGDVDDAATATREAKEEIGLDPSLLEVVAFLEPFLSKHLLQVIPVISILSDRNAFTPIPNVDEVDDVFDAPLEMFLKDENRRSEEREWMGDKFLVHYFDYETGGKKYVIWGLTAGILIRAASVVFQRPPAFLEQNLKFKVPKPGHTIIP